MQGISWSVSFLVYFLLLEIIQWCEKLKWVIWHLILLLSESAKRCCYWGRPLVCICRYCSKMGACFLKKQAETNSVDHKLGRWSLEKPTVAGNSTCHCTAIGICGPFCWGKVKGSKRKTVSGECLFYYRRSTWWGIFPVPLSYVSVLFIYLYCKWIASFLLYVIPCPWFWKGLNKLFWTSLWNLHIDSIVP